MDIPIPNRAAGFALVVVAILLASAFGYFSICWQVGNMLAELTPATQPGSEEIAEAALGLAPNDPVARWLFARKKSGDLSDEGIRASVRHFEAIVAAGPYDFRWWIELGRAYEQAEQPEKAEPALLQAVKLAPEYTFPRWQLGNFYLRQGRSDEAFEQFSRTTEKSSIYREQSFSLAWDFYDGDAARLEKLAGTNPDTRASLARFLAEKGASAEALNIWNRLSDEQKEKNSYHLRPIAQGLWDKGLYREAVEFARQGGIDPDSMPEAITNPGFENFIGVPEETLFGWHLNRKDPGVSIGAESTVKHEGKKSLRVTFKGFARPEFHNVVQHVAVDPGRDYRLSFWLRTEDLRSGGPPLLEVGNVIDNKVIAASEPFPDGTNTWRQIVLEFTAPENCTGVILKTGRVFCGENCPIAGTFWYDDFHLERR